MIGEFIAGLIGGAFIHAGLAHRRARLDLGVLFYLHEHGDTYSLDIRNSEHGGGGVYVRLGRLEGEGLIEGWVPPFESRRKYRLTDAGRAWLKVEAAKHLAAQKDRDL